MNGETESSTAGLKISAEEIQCQVCGMFQPITLLPYFFLTKYHKSVILLHVILLLGVSFVPCLIHTQLFLGFLFK